MNKPEKNLVISKKLKGDDGHKTFSIRIKDETVERLDDLAKKTNRSRNDLINMLLDYAMDYCEVK
ncbi:MAG: ribbon-helix-helix protein, CopG family [Clostridia bacterium]|nr:ribbon-helix-helix protein, CopG family [Clostridia bacterium]